MMGVHVLGCTGGVEVHSGGRGDVGRKGGRVLALADDSARAQVILCLLLLSLYPLYLIIYLLYLHPLILPQQILMYVCRW